MFFPLNIELFVLSTTINEVDNMILLSCYQAYISININKKSDVLRCFTNQIKYHKLAIKININIYIENKVLANYNSQCMKFILY